MIGFATNALSGSGYSQQKTITDNLELNSVKGNPPWIHNLVAHLANYISRIKEGTQRLNGNFQHRKWINYHHLTAEKVKLMQDILTPHPEIMQRM